MTTVKVTHGRVVDSPHPTGKPFHKFITSKGQPDSPTEVTVGSTTKETGSCPDPKVSHPYSRGEFGIPEQMKHLGDE